MNRFVCCLALMSLLAATAQTFADEKPKEKSKSERAVKNQAVARVTGKLVCAHCDLSIGDACQAAIQTDDAVFVLTGQANEDLVEKRQTGVACRVLGTLSVKEGNLYLNGFHDKKAPGDAKPEMLITGQVVKAGDALTLHNGNQTIRVRGTAAKTLGKNTGKWMEVVGVFKVDRKGRIQLTAKSAKPVTGPPKLPAKKKPAEKE